MIEVSLTGLDFVNLDAERHRVALSRALNATVRRARTDTAQHVRQVLALPAAYSAPSSGRLMVGQPASPSRLVTEIVARDEPIPLARFARGTPVHGKPATIMVKPGITRSSPRMIYIRTRRGEMLVALRLRPGETVRSKWSPPRSFIAPNMPVLFGPTLAQVALQRRGGGYWPEREQAWVNYLLSEYLRLAKWV